MESLETDKVGLVMRVEKIHDTNNKLRSFLIS